MIKKLIILGSLLLFLNGCNPFTQKPGQIEIISPAKTIFHPLTKNAVISVNGKISTVKVEVKNRRVRVIQSDCPDKICMKTGWISHWYEFILCAPNQVSVRIRFFSVNPDQKITY